AAGTATAQRGSASRASLAMLRCIASAVPGTALERVQKINCLGGVTSHLDAQRPGTFENPAAFPGIRAVAGFSFARRLSDCAAHRVVLSGAQQTGPRRARRQA